MRTSTTSTGGYPGTQVPVVPTTPPQHPYVTTSHHDTTSSTWLRLSEREEYATVAKHPLEMLGADLETGRPAPEFPDLTNVTNRTHNSDGATLQKRSTSSACRR